MCWNLLPPFPTNFSQFLDAKIHMFEIFHEVSIRKYFFFFILSIHTHFFSVTLLRCKTLKFFTCVTLFTCCSLRFCYCCFIFFSPCFTVLFTCPTKCVALSKSVTNTNHFRFICWILYFIIEFCCTFLHSFVGSEKL